MSQNTPEPQAATATTTTTTATTTATATATDARRTGDEPRLTPPEHTTWPDKGGTTIHRIPSPLVIAIRERLKASQNLEEDGDLAAPPTAGHGGGLSNAALVTAWLTVSLGVNPGIENDPAFTRACRRLAASRDSYGVEERLTRIERAIGRLGRMGGEEVELLRAMTTPVAITHDLTAFIAAWQTNPNQASADGMLNRVDVNWREALIVGEQAEKANRRRREGGAATQIAHKTPGQQHRPATTTPRRR